MPPNLPPKAAKKEKTTAEPTYVASLDNLYQLIVDRISDHEYEWTICFMARGNGDIHTGSAPDQKEAIKAAKAYWNEYKHGKNIPPFSR